MWIWQCHISSYINNFSAKYIHFASLHFICTYLSPLGTQSACSVELGVSGSFPHACNSPHVLAACSESVSSWSPREPDALVLTWCQPTVWSSLMLAGIHHMTFRHCSGSTVMGRPSLSSSTDSSQRYVPLCMYELCVWVRIVSVGVLAVLLVNWVYQISVLLLYMLRAQWRRRSMTAKSPRRPLLFALWIRNKSIDTSAILTCLSCLSTRQPLLLLKMWLYGSDQRYCMLHTRTCS